MLPPLREFWVDLRLARGTVEICTVVNTFGSMNISTPVIPSQLRIAQYYRGILRVLEFVIDGLDEISTGDVFMISECVYLAGANASKAQHDEIELQWSIWKKLDL